MSRLSRILFLLAFCLLAACTSSPESVASGDDTGAGTSALGSTEIQVETTAAEQSTETTPTDTSVTIETIQEIRTDDAVVINNEIVTVGAASTRPPITAPVAVQPATCSTASHQITIPAGWSHRDCEVFTSGTIPEIGAERAFRPEIDVAFSASETYDEALTRIWRDEAVIEATATIASDLPATTFVLEDNAFELGQRRTVVVVDTGVGAFFAAVNGAIDIQGELRGGSLESHYAYSVGVFEQILSDVSIDFTPLECSVPASVDSPEFGFADAVEIVRGSADIDGDGQNETVVMFQSETAAFLAIEGLPPGLVWGPVERHVGGLATLGWNDWDGDGSPELFTPGDGGASGGRANVYAVEGCSISPVVTTDGAPFSLWSRASGLSANGYVCNVDAEGQTTSVETTVTTIDGETGAFSNEVTAFTYANGVLTTTASPQGTPPAGNHDSTFGSCAIELS